MSPLILAVASAAVGVAVIVAQRLFGGSAQPTSGSATATAPAVQAVSPAAIQAAVTTALAGHPALQSLAQVMGSPLAQAFVSHLVDQGTQMADAWLQQHAAGFASLLMQPAPAKDKAPAVVAPPK